MGTQLLVGGRIYSSSSPDATAMAVTDGMVVWVGADQPGRALHPDADVLDLDGAFVAPGFVDAHVHTTATGLLRTGLDLTGARSLPECLELIGDHARTHPGELIWGHGWDESGWPENRPPTAADLESVAPGRTIYLTRIDVHSAVCSPALLDAAAGRSGFDRSGVLTADAHHAVRAVARTGLAPDQRAQAQRAALDAAAAAGIVAVHECAGPDISGREDLRQLLDTPHGVEVRGYWGEAVDSADAATALRAATGAQGLGGDLFVDGALGSHTAWLLEPYADDSGHGRSYLDVDTITTHLRACTTARIQAGFHAIGDGAVTAVVSAFERVVAELGTPAVAACGHRVEHLEMVTPEQGAKLGSWGVIASVQPVFDALWGGDGGMYVRRLGAERGVSLNPFAALASSGVSLALGSDAPVTPMSPWAAVRAAVAHRTPGSGISARAAFAAATRGAWRAGGVRDGLAGTLDPGAPASYAVWDAGDLVVAAGSDRVARWSTDPRSRVPGLPRLDPGEPLPQCLRTVHRGVTVHAR